MASITRSASFELSHFDRAIKSSVSTLGDKRIKEITSLQRKVILGFLKGRDCLVVREQNEAVEMRGCPGAIAFEYTHER